MEEIKRSEILSLRNTLLVCKDIKSTKIANMVLENLGAVENAYNGMMSELQKGVMAVMEKYKHLEDKIAPFNQELNKLLASTADPKTGMARDPKVFRAGVEEILNSNEECREFYLEQEKYVADFHEQKIKISLKYVHQKDLPDNLSATDISLLGQFITDVEVVA